METYTRSNVTWPSHSAQISQIKDHINKAGEILAQLQSARAEAQPWHQDTIDRITPVLKQLASDTEAIINHLNETLMTAAVDCKAKGFGDATSRADSPHGPTNRAVLS